jgi:hypothetical protein
LKSATANEAKAKHEQQKALAAAQAESKQRQQAEHNYEAALEAALKAHAIIKPDYTLFLGDVLDCGIFSMHPKRKISETQSYDFKKLETDPCNKMLDRVQKNTKIHTHFLGGNHEERIERWAVGAGAVGRQGLSQNPHRHHVGA